MTTYRRIAAVKTTVEILRHLAEQKEPAPGAQIAAALGLPGATVMCHLATLEDERLVRRVGESWELDMGLALFWARYKTQVEGKIGRLQGELRQLEV